MKTMFFVDVKTVICLKNNKANASLVIPTGRLGWIERFFCLLQVNTYILTTASIQRQYFETVCGHFQCLANVSKRDDMDVRYLITDFN